METRYILTESELLEILEDRIMLAALEDADVYMWPSFESANEVDEFPDENEIADRAKEALANYETFC